MTDRVEFRANLPWIDKISPEALAFRAKNGITKTLDMATACANPIAHPDAPKNQLARGSSKALIAACNFSASQCVKELKKRGIPFKG